MDNSFWFELTSLIVLIICSGFFSGSETAFTAASKAKLATLEKEGSKRARLLNILRKDSDKVISSILFGNNLVNIMSSAIATSALIKIFGQAGVAYATLAVTFLVLVFAEVMPKTYALANAERISLAVAPVLGFLVKIFTPITYGVAKIVNAVFKLLKIKAPTLEEEHETELRGAIQIFKDHVDDEDIDTGSMLGSILDLEEVEVEEIMVHRKNVRMVNSDMPIEDLINEVMRSPYTRMPVWKEDQDNIIGVIHSKLVLRELLAVGGDVNKIDIKKTMMDPWFIPETTYLSDQLEAFRKRREHFSIMVDEYGVFVGIVTLEDILEEIVGEIDDEYDSESLTARAQPDGSFIVNGDMTIRDINRDLDWNLPDEEYSTVAGLVLFESRTIPAIGQLYHFFDYKFEVVKRVKNQITLLKITPLETID